MAVPKEPKFRKDGMPDGRGHGEGSKATWYAQGDGRRRPGRTKGALSLGTIHRTAGGAIITLTLQNGKTKRMSRAEAVILKQLDLALKGNQRAAQSFLDKYEQYSPVDVQPDGTALKMMEDEQILGILAGADRRGLLGPVEPPDPGANAGMQPGEVDASSQGDS